MRPDKVALEAYIRAKHQMTLADLRVAVVVQQRRVEASEKEAAYHGAVLTGYTKALGEKQ